MSDPAIAQRLSAKDVIAKGMAAFRRARQREFLLAAVLLVVVAMVPGLFTDAYTMNVLILTLLYAALAQSWNILGGYCGQVSLGHALYFGIGAYATSILYVNFGVLPWFGLVLGGVLAAIVGLALAGMCVRLAGHYFTIATIVIAEIGLTAIHNWDYAGAALGIQWPFVPDSWATLQFARNKTPYFHFVLGFFAVTWVVTYAIQESRWGYWWRAVKDNPEAAESLGVTIYSSKMIAAAISAFFTAIGGGFYAAFLSYIDPESVMSFRFSLLMALPAVLGGIGTLWGPVVGAVILIPLSEVTRSYFGGTGSGTDLIVYGVMIMTVALARPEGLLSLLPRRSTRSAP